MTTGRLLVGCILFSVMVNSSQTQQLADHGSDTDTTNINNFAFELPDLTVSVVLDDGHSFDVEAFKTVKNDRIFMDIETSPSKASQLQWVSIGRPVFVRSKKKRNSTDLRLFHVAEDEFYVSIQMLTPDHKRMLRNLAREKYGISVTEIQFSHLPLTQFECVLSVYDNNGINHLLRGEVGNFKVYPLIMDFKAPKQSSERTFFAEKLADDSANLRFRCNLYAASKLLKTNTLTIEASQLEQIGLADKLFGDAQSVYVTRDQLAELASEMYSMLNIVEDYQMPEHAFGEAFIDGLVSQLTTEQFKKVPFDDAISSLSRYTFDVRRDLQPDVVKRNLSKIFRVERVGDKARIVAYRANTDSQQAHNSMSGSTNVDSSAGGGFKMLSLFDTSMKLSAKVANSYDSMNSRSSNTTSTSLDDQLSELNDEFATSVEWDIDGDKVVPRSLNVVRLLRSRLSSRLRFQRVQYRTYDTPFSYSLTLYTRDADLVVVEPSRGDRPIVDQLATETGSRFDEIAASVTNVSAALQEIVTGVRTLTAAAKQPERHSSGCYSGSTSSGGGAEYDRILIQQHYNGTTSFNRTWAEFKAGFADPGDNFWIGNDRLYELTKNGQYKLRVDLRAQYNNDWHWAEYSMFRVAQESSGYRVTVGGYSGNAGDSLSSVNGMKFTTRDRDNDRWANGNCAVDARQGHGGGFWYRSCGHALVNSPMNSTCGFAWLHLPFGTATCEHVKLLASRMTLVRF